jgi:hypothetical protein
MQSRRPQLSKTRDTNLDPVGVILSLLEELSADEFRRIVSLSGLSVDWQLSKVENFSLSTRKRAYIPKVQAALGLLAEEERLQVLAMIAGDAGTEHRCLLGAASCPSKRFLFKVGDLLTVFCDCHS